MKLKEFVTSWKGKKELYDLPALSIETLDIKTDEFTTEEGVKKNYNFIEIDGYKYSLRAPILAQLKEIVTNKPLATKIQFKRAPNGDIIVIDL